MFRNRFFISLTSVILYELFVTTLRPDGFSVTKIAITLLAWTAFAFSLYNLIAHRKRIGQDMPRFARWVFILLLLWNTVSILRSSLGDIQSATTLFGNPYTTLALLVPFALPFGLDKAHLRVVHLCCVFWIGLSLVFTAFSVSGISFVNTTDSFSRLPTFFLYLVVFLITTMSFETGKTKVMIVMASILLLVLSGVIGGSRATLARVSLLYLSLVALTSFKRFSVRWIPAAAMIAFFIPPYLVYTSADGDHNIFRMSHSYIQNSLKADSAHNTTFVFEKADTRTFLYQEVFDDLVQNNSLLAGKGSNGTYFSPYFLMTRDDTDTRLTVEVGILAVLLKGGMIAVILNLTLLLFAIYLAFYRSKNHYVMGIGFMLLIHTIILFVENLISYSPYNFCTWYFIGVCYSSKIRMMDDTEIKTLLIGRSCEKKVLLRNWSVHKGG